MTTTQVRIPVVTVRRWLHRSGRSLPVPLTGLAAVRADLDLDVVTELTSPRLGGEATPSRLEGLDPAQAQALTTTMQLLDSARVIAFVMRSENDRTTTAAGIVAGRDGMLLVDTPEELTLRALPATEVLDAVVRALPSMRPARLRPTQVPAAALEALASEAGSGRDGRERVAAQAGIDVQVLDELDRIQGSRRAFGILGACRPDDLTGAVAADWFDSSRGALLKMPVPDGGCRFAPADRASMTSFLVSAVAAVG